LSLRAKFLKVGLRFPNVFLNESGYPSIELFVLGISLKSLFFPCHIDSVNFATEDISAFPVPI
jgi:hypothetical protein